MKSTWLIIFSCILAGLLLGFSQPFVIPGSTTPLDPTGMTGLLALIGYVPAYLLLREGSIGRAFRIGFFTSFVHFAIILHWLVIAVHVFGHVNLLTSIGVVLLLPAVLALYIGAAFALTRFLVVRFQWP